MKNLENHVALTAEQSRDLRSSTASHTPGPWTAFWSEENTRTKIGSWRFAHQETAPVPHIRCARNNHTAEANARLIAAAPDMLAALQVVAEWTVDMGSPTLDGKPLNVEGAVFGPRTTKMREAVRAAIAKATGAA